MEKEKSNKEQAMKDPGLEEISQRIVLLVAHKKLSSL